MGKIEIDHTGAGSGITLSSDGTDLLLNGTAIGGGGAALELYAENPSSPTAPSATGTNGVAIGSGAVASGFTSVSLGSDTDSTATSSVAIGSNSQALGVKSLAIQGNATARESTAIGVNNLGSLATAAGEAAMALGGSYASGADSFAAAIANNTSSYGATGANSIAMGDRARASGSSSIALGGLTTNSNNSVAIGQSANATGINAVSIGISSSATQSNAVAIGPQATSTVRGKISFGNGSFVNPGDSQQGVFIMRSDTTDATPEELRTNNAATGNNQVILPNNSAYAFHGTIVARQQASAGTASAAWKIEGLIRREGSAGTTVLVNSATTVLDNTPAWGMALSADTTNGGLKIEVTGAAATNIRWVATVHTSEVTY